MRVSVLLAVLAGTVATGTANAADRCTVREAQQALTDLGFDPGPIDGAMGRLTRGALIAYQKANELPATGYLNVDTCRALTAPIPTAPESAAGQTTPGGAAQSDASQPDGKQAPAAPAPESGTATAAVPAADTTTSPVAPDANASAAGTPSDANTSQAEPSAADAAASDTPAALTEQAPDTASDAAPAIPAVAAATPPAPPAPPPEPGYKRITDPVALYRTAFGLHKSGSYYVAANAFEHYLRTFGDHDRVPDALYWLSEAYVLTGQDNEARESLEQFLTAFPGHRYTDEVRSRLDGISPVTQ